MSLSTSNTPALRTCFRRSRLASSSSPNSVTGCFRKRRRRMTSGFGRTRLSMFCSSVREVQAAAAADEDEAEAVVEERLKNFLPPMSCARDWRFLRSSCFRRSI
ncbi:hypothetical protein PHAVU_001G152300 [Phaseolus vulgaris]|uniref:Uncharacterized protein n=1 Tax=Phaseolus vulgaris TaxID=3885 RepID=V7CWC9_PHAVU|nr:hypothetical protein PHAVU_001G152300g [Phaseolus vulgaris]ESW34434.1 hypothetical protein PHAVU_001G152300g [Phaseolus vulgaris]